MSQSDTEKLQATSLGRIEIKKQLLEHDLAVADRYQAFSAEMVRLAILGIAGIGFLVVNVFLEDDSPSCAAKIFIVLSLVSLGIAIAAGLLHRYAGTDSLACHLRLLRLEIRGRPGDEKLADDEREQRNKWFKISGRLLAIACISLWIGAVCLAVALVIGVF